MLSIVRCNSPSPIVSLEISAHPEENVSISACTEVRFHIIFRSQLFSCLTCCQWEHIGLREKVVCTVQVALEWGVYGWPLFSLFFSSHLRKQRIHSQHKHTAMVIQTHTHKTHRTWCAVAVVVVWGQGHAVSLVYSHNPLCWMGKRLANG